MLHTTFHSVHSMPQLTDMKYEVIVVLMDDGSTMTNTISYSKGRISLPDSIQTNNIQYLTIQKTTKNIVLSFIFKTTSSKDCYYH